MYPRFTDVLGGLGSRRRCVAGACLATLVFLAGCTGPVAWLTNGLKVGPNYVRPGVAVAEDWIDAADVRLRQESVDHNDWWTVFNDPVLNALVAEAYQQNLPLRVAGFRVLQARAMRAIAAGEFFPQLQDAFADYEHHLTSNQTGAGSLANRHFDIWDAGFNLSWELDFWGRFRRAVEAADDDLDVSIENYDDVLVTLLADVATTYIEARTLQRRLELANGNLAIQRRTYERANERFRNGKLAEIDVQQLKSNLANTEALIPELENLLRLANNRLCVLLGRPAEEIVKPWSGGPMPQPPSEVAAGIPADLVRRRPDVRRAERMLAAQSARIGVAESDFYPHIAVSGTIGVDASRFNDLFASGASFGSIGPSLRWDILNYSRIRNNVRVQDAVFQQLALNYQQAVLQANQEAENAIVTFLKSQQRLRSLSDSVAAAQRTNELVSILNEEVQFDTNRLFTLQNFLTQQQDTMVQVQGNVALALVDLYRALGGGWQIRLGPLPQR